MKLSNILFGKLLNEDRTSEELLKDIQPAIGKALQDYYAQIKNLSAAMIKDFGQDLLSPANSFLDAAEKLIRSGKSTEGNALQNFPQQNAQNLKYRLSINTKNGIAFDNKLKGLKQTLLGQVGAKANQDNDDSTEGGIQGRSKGDIEARIMSKTEEGKALIAKLSSFKSDQRREEYVLSPEFQQLIKKVDPNFLTKARGMAKLNPEALANIDGFRIKANKFLQENKRSFLLEQESTLDGFIFDDVEGVTNIINNFQFYLEKNNTAPSTIAALENLKQTVTSIKDIFKTIKIPSKIVKLQNL